MLVGLRIGHANLCLHLQDERVSLTRITDSTFGPKKQALCAVPADIRYSSYSQLTTPVKTRSMVVLHSGGFTALHLPGASTFGESELLTTDLPYKKETADSSDTDSSSF